MGYKFITRKESIIISAIDILSMKGIKGMTMKEIAKAEGVSEPAIYKQYKSKNDVILAILDKFSKYDDQIIATVTEQKLEAKEGLVFFASSVADYYQGYPEVATVMFSLDVFRYNDETNELMESIINKRYEFIKTHVRRGIEKELFCINMDEEIIIDMIYGFIMHTTFGWKNNNHTYELKERVLKMLESIFHG